MAHTFPSGRARAAQVRIERGGQERWVCVENPETDKTVDVKEGTEGFQYEGLRPSLFPSQPRRYPMSVRMRECTFPRDALSRTLIRAHEPSGNFPVSIVSRTWKGMNTDVAVEIAPFDDGKWHWPRSGSEDQTTTNGTEAAFLPTPSANSSPIQRDAVRPGITPLRR